MLKYLKRCSFSIKMDLNDLLELLENSSEISQNDIYELSDSMRTWDTNVEADEDNDFSDLSLFFSYLNDDSSTQYFVILIEYIRVEAQESINPSQALDDSNRLFD